MSDEGLFQQIVAVNWRADPLTVPALNLPKAIITEPAWEVEVVKSDRYGFGDCTPISPCWKQDNTGTVRVDGSVLHTGTVTVTKYLGCDVQVFGAWPALSLLFAPGVHIGNGNLKYDIWNGTLDKCAGTDGTAIEAHFAYEGGLPTRDSAAVQTAYQAYLSELEDFDVAKRPKYQSRADLLAQYDAGYSSYRDTVETLVPAYVSASPDVDALPSATVQDDTLHGSTVGAVQAAHSVFVALVDDLDIAL